MIQISKIAITLGQRIRNFRMQQGLSQERLAELAGVHPTYIGQIERGEKNITVESLEKVAAALRAPLWKIFEKIGPEAAEDDYPLAAYDLLAAQNIKEQKRLQGHLQEINAYKNSKTPGWIHTKPTGPPFFIYLIALRAVPLRKCL